MTVGDECRLLRRKLRHRKNKLKRRLQPFFPSCIVTCISAYIIPYHYLQGLLSCDLQHDIYQVIHEIECLGQRYLHITFPNTGVIECDVEGFYFHLNSSTMNWFIGARHLLMMYLAMPRRRNFFTFANAMAQDEDYLDFKEDVLACAPEFREYIDKRINDRLLKN